MTFQLVSDLRDVSHSTVNVGKAKGKDSAFGNWVYAGLLGRRSGDLAILRSLGTPPAWLVGGMVLEVSLAALIAVGSGIVVGMCLAHMAAPALAETLSDLVGISLELAPSLPAPWTWILLLGAAPTAGLGAAPAISRALADAGA